MVCDISLCGDVLAKGKNIFVQFFIKVCEMFVKDGLFVTAKKDVLLVCGGVKDGVCCGVFCVICGF